MSQFRFVSPLDQQIGFIPARLVPCRFRQQLCQPCAGVKITQTTWSVFHVRLQMEQGLLKFRMARTSQPADSEKQRLPPPLDQSWNALLIQFAEQGKISGNVA